MILVEEHQDRLNKSPAFPKRASSSSFEQNKFWCIAEKKSFAWPPKQLSCEAELASGDLSHGGIGRMVGEPLATAAMWNAAGEAG